MKKSSVICGSLGMLLVFGAGCTAKSRQPSSDSAPASATHALESPQPGEEQLIHGLVAGIAANITTTRDAHPKAHGCAADARLTVNADLAPEYRKGVFAQPGQTFEAIVRFSSGSSNPKADDRAPSTQGFAVKIKLPQALASQIPDLPGQVMVLPEETYRTFDIITINALSEFMVNDLPSYPAFFKASGMVAKASAEAVAAGKSPAEIKQIVGQIFAQEYISKVPAQLQPVVGALLAKAGSAQAQDLLDETYNSWVPYAFDAERAVKYSFQPCSKLAKRSAAAPSANFLGERLHEELSDSSNEGCFDLVAQFHEQGMPSVEDAALPWGAPESRKYVKLARLTLGSAFTPIEFCQALSYNPAHALPDQRGIGAIQRARRAIYAEISALRNKNVAAQQPKAE